MALSLRDARHLRFSNSLLGIVETSLCNSPVSFNCYPNFKVLLTDIHILDVLTLDIETKGYEIKLGIKNIAVIYRIYYKVLTTLTPKVKKFDAKGKITLFEVNMNKSDVSIPKILNWFDIQRPERWSLLGVVAPTPTETANREVEQIVKTPDGNVEIYFN